MATDRLQLTVDRIHQEVPVLEDARGYEGLLLLVDRDAGRLSALTLWQSMNDMKATERSASEARAKVGEDTRSAEQVVIDRYEVAGNTTLLADAAQRQTPKLATVTDSQA